MANVTIAQGKLKGGQTKTDSGFEYFEFLGIPYAKPPVDRLRFQTPQAPEPWDNERDATKIDLKNISCQENFFTGGTIGSEDCLYLNVYTPTLPDSKSELLPVMVYIHGGGFIYGNGINKPDNGPDFIIEQNVVVVTINYRLGIFGFLCLDIPEAAGNMGLKDQVEALKWVQNNINKFCGDKNNVTIFGISAGSASIDYLVLSPLAKGIFHKAILQSGSALNDWAINFEPKQLVSKLLEQSDYKGSKEDNVAIYEFLRQLPASALSELAFKTIKSFTSKRFYFGFVPTIEKDFGNGDSFLITSPYKQIQSGNINKVPIIKGFCEREGLLMDFLKPEAATELIKTKRFVDHWSYVFDTEDIEKYNRKLLEAYMENIKLDDEHDKLSVDFFGDLNFVAGIWISAKMMSSYEIPIYMYKFSYDGKLNGAKSMFDSKRKGCAHGDDTPYVLRIKALDESTIDDADKLVRSKFIKLWTNFAKTSDPSKYNREESFVKWPRFYENFPVYLNLGKKLEVELDYEPKKIAIFEEIYNKYQK